MFQEIIHYSLWIVWDIVDLVCVYYVMHVIFNMTKTRPRKRVVSYFILYIFMSLCHTWVVQPNNAWGLLLFIPYYIKAFPIICECLKGKSKIQILVSILLYEILLNFAQEIILWILAIQYPNLINGTYSWLIIYLGLGMLIIIGMAVVKKRKKMKLISLYSSSLSVKTYIFLGLATFSFMVIGGLVFTRDNLSQELMCFIKIVLIVLLISLVGLLITLFSTSKEKSIIQKVLYLLEEQMENMIAYYREISKKDEELRRFKHDSKNLLVGLYSMLEAKDIEQAKQYIKNMEDIYQSGVLVYDSGNYIGDAIMSTKKSIASQFNITVDFNGNIPAQKIKDTDLCIFLTNVLDNAIEACQKIEGERYIHVESKVVEEMWVVVVSNPVKEQLEIVDNIVETTKEDKEIHGYGLLSIKRVVEKYCGKLKIEITNGMFVLKASFVLRGIG